MNADESNIHNRSSKIRLWAEREKNRLQDYTKGKEVLFAVMMYGLSRFGNKPSEENTLHSMGLGTSEHYGNDAALFELGCYLYVRFDVWLFANKQHLREEFSRYFMYRFIPIFSAALNIENIYELFNERVDKYGELARNGEDLERYHFYLIQLILRTKDGAIPKRYNFDNEQICLDFDQLGIKIELGIWETCFMSAILESLEIYCAPKLE